MAEIGLIASIVGLIGAGTKLSIAIFDFASGIGSAGKELQALGTDISLLCAVLEHLHVLLETAHFHPTDAAIATAQRIVDECKKVCDEIEGILAALRAANDNAWIPSAEFVGKVRSTFSKKKVIVLRPRLESYKLTLSVMLNTMSLAERRSQRPHRRELDFAEDDRHNSMTQSLIISQQCAVDQLEHYEDEVEKENEIGTRQPVPDAAVRPNERTRRQSRIRLNKMFSGLSLITSLPTPAETSEATHHRAQRTSIWLDSVLAPDNAPVDPHPGALRKKRMSSAGTAKAPAQLLQKWTDQGDQTGQKPTASPTLQSGDETKVSWKDCEYSFSSNKQPSGNDTATVVMTGQSGIVRQTTDLISPRTTRLDSVGFHLVAGMNGTLESSNQLQRIKEGHDSYAAITAIILKEYASPVKSDDVVLCVSYGGKTKVLNPTDKPLEVLRHYEELELDPRVFLRARVC